MLKELLSKELKENLIKLVIDNNEYKLFEKIYYHPKFDSFKDELLEEKVFMKEFEWYDWVIFLSLIGGIVALAFFGILYWRKRKI